MLNQKGATPLVIILGILVALGAAIGVYYSKKGYPPKFQPQNSVTTPNSAQPSDDPESIRFSPVLFDKAGRFFFDLSFSDVLKDIPDSSLESIQCSPTYRNSSSGLVYEDTFYFYEDESNPVAQHPYDAKDILPAMRHTDENITRYIHRFQVCNLPSEKKIILYNISDRYMADGTYSYVFRGVKLGFLGKDSITEIASFNETTRYFGCRPLLLTKSSLLYVDCSAGDGGSGTSELYEVNLNDKKTKTIIECDDNRINPDATNTIDHCRQSP